MIYQMLIGTLLPGEKSLGHRWTNLHIRFIRAEETEISNLWASESWLRSIIIEQDCSDQGLGARKNMQVLQIKLPGSKGENYLTTQASHKGQNITSSPKIAWIEVENPSAPTQLHRMPFQITAG